MNPRPPFPELPPRTPLPGPPLINKFYQISPQEISSLAAAFKDTSQVHANGLTIGGDKFFAIRADDRSIYGKKVCTNISPRRSTYVQDFKYTDAKHYRARKVSSSSRLSPVLLSPTTPKPSRPPTPQPWSRTSWTTSTTPGRWRFGKENNKMKIYPGV